MNYIGKSLDGFEYAMNSLLMRENRKPVPHLDCISLRCFGFECEGHPGGWFRPVIQWSTYLDRVLLTLGCHGCYAKASDVAVTETSFERWTLLGEISGKHFDLSIQSRFYPELSGFFLCKMRQDGILNVTNPTGQAYIETEVSVLAEILAQSQGFVLQIDDPGCGEMPDWKMLLHDALAWHSHHDQTAGFDFAANYRGGVREKITLQYCLMNHQIQLSKVLKLAAQIPGIDIAPLERHLAAYPQIAMNGNVKNLGELEKGFWDTFKEMEAGS